MRLHALGVFSDRLIVNILTNISRVSRRLGGLQGESRFPAGPVWVLGSDRRDVLTSAPPRHRPAWRGLSESRSSTESIGWMWTIPGIKPHLLFLRGNKILFLLSCLCVTFVWSNYFNHYINICLKENVLSEIQHAHTRHALHRLQSAFSAWSLYFHQIISILLLLFITYLKKTTFMGPIFAKVCL